MPIRIPNALPSAAVLSGENIFVMTEDRATTQDIRPLKIAIFNADENYHRNTVASFAQ